MIVREFGNGSRIEAEVIEGGADIALGRDVVVTASRLAFGAGVRIGPDDEESAFRFPGGTRINCRELVLGDRVRIGRHVLIRGGQIHLKRDCSIGNASTIRVNRQLLIGEHGVVNDQCEISGMDIEIGRELWMLPTAQIGGGSAFEVQSSLRAGHWLHLGRRTFVNTARRVVLGDEVGLGTGTSLYTHGAYASALDGKPVAFGQISIGDRTWIPGGIVNPSVSIGADCVIGVGSVVNRDIPAGALAGGIPAKVIRENAYPSRLEGKARLTFIQQFIRSFAELFGDQEDVHFEETSEGAHARIGSGWVGYHPMPHKAIAEAGSAGTVVVLTEGSDDKLALAWGGPDPTIFELPTKQLSGPCSNLSERLLRELRRYGIRFNYEVRDNRYQPWD